MPLPKTNLFKGDRVKHTRVYVVSRQLQSKHFPVSKYANRVGTIVSDTLDPAFDVIVVQWDGCGKPEMRKDRGYHPDDLQLVEDEYV